MVNFFEQFENYYLFSLGLVGDFFGKVIFFVFFMVVLLVFLAWFFFRLGWKVFLPLSLSLFFCSSFRPIFNFFEQFENYYLFSLGLVGVATTVLGWHLINILFNSSDSNPTSSPDGASPDGASPDGASPDDKNKWKKQILIGLGVVTLVVFSLGFGGWYGWKDVFFVVKEPAQFGGAVIDRLGSVLPGLTYEGPDMKKFLLSTYAEVWKVAAAPETLMEKMINAGVRPADFGSLQENLIHLSTHPQTVIERVMSTYPRGASEATLRAALRVGINDEIDVTILEYATDFF